MGNRKNRFGFIKVLKEFVKALYGVLDFLGMCLLHSK
jgi:hypothetical protein